MSLFDWDAATEEERNAKCAAFMPASEVNPNRLIEITVTTQKTGQTARLNYLRMQKPNIQGAREWLEKCKADKKTWEKEFDNWPWLMRDQIDVREVTWHVRYSDTPGGAWMLMEQLNAQGVSMQVTWREDAVEVAVEQDHRALSVKGKMTFAETACVAFLLFSGVEVVSAHVTSTRYLRGDEGWERQEADTDAHGQTRTNTAGEDGGL